MYDELTPVDIQKMKEEIEYRVTVLRQVPEEGTCDMAAWLILAEVDSSFRDGDTLWVVFEEQ